MCFKLLDLPLLGDRHPSAHFNCNHFYYPVTPMYFLMPCFAANYLRPCAQHWPTGANFSRVSWLPPQISSSMRRCFPLSPSHLPTSPKFQLLTHHRPSSVWCSLLGARLLCQYRSFGVGHLLPMGRRVHQVCFATAFPPSSSFPPPSSFVSSLSYSSPLSPETFSQSPEMGKLLSKSNFR